MARFYSFLILLFVVFLSIADADLRVRRTPQFSQASASAGSFGNYPRGFGQANFGPPAPPGFGRQFGGSSPGFGPQFGGGPPGFGPQFGGGSPRFGPQLGGRPPVFGPPGFGNSGLGRPGSGPSINIAKSISISAGGRGGGARSSAGGFGK